MTVRKQKVVIIIYRLYKCKILPSGKEAELKRAIAASG